MKMINKVLIEVYTEWDHAGSVFTFPIPTYNITKDFNWDNENLKPAIEVVLNGQYRGNVDKSTSKMSGYWTFGVKVA